MSQEDRLGGIERSLLMRRSQRSRLSPMLDWDRSPRSRSRSHARRVVNTEHRNARLIKNKITAHTSELKLQLKATLPASVLAATPLEEPLGRTETGAQ